MARPLKLPARVVLSIVAPPPKFVIVGTGRCGTESAARHLTAHGLRCGHEQVFSTDGYHPRFGFVGCASWLAAMHLEGYSGYVAHLVRHPEDTVRSLLQLGAFDPTCTNPHFEIIRKFVPLKGEPVDEAFRWWLTWNERCERFAQVRFQLPNLTELVEHLIFRFNRIAGERTTEASGAITERVYNRKMDKKVCVFGNNLLAQIKDNALRDAVISKAESYRFSVEA